MSEKLGLRDLAPPPGGLGRLQYRLNTRRRRPVQFAWAGGAAVALLLTVSLVLRPSAVELPSWAADHPRLRIVDGVAAPLQLKKGAAKRLAKSANVTVYLVDVARPPD